MESYYGVLGVSPDSSAADIRTSYRRLALKWHPDRWQRRGTRGGSPAAEEAIRRFQLIHEAYQVLSDERKRKLYDADLYGDDHQEEEEVEGFADFVQEMVSLMADVSRQDKKVHSLEELQQMFREMTGGFDAAAAASSSQGQRYPAFGPEAPRSTKRSRCDDLIKNQTVVERSSLGLRMFGSMPC